MDKLEQLAQKLNSADNARAIAGYKGRITRAIAELVEQKGVEQTRAIVFSIATKYNLEYLIKRFEIKIFQENDSVYGWWDLKSQVMAEILPLERASKGYHVKYDDARKGFYKAASLPVSFSKYYCVDGSVAPSTEVTIESNTQEWINLGYAKPCKLQFQMNLERNEYTVTRSIIEEGFWTAYKWWDGCRSWYEDLHPEWFGDMPYWQAKDDRAVLGGENKDYWESQKIE